ncbi:hypothetical protein FKR81_09455 [Lentzea tibetensis]|uniref:Uncharacterized protein n=1 Tax=Lentzea tibetensis TaxID=2591470 RepID=A0A563EXZ7_9PSEU|nr:hypothetical protein [Lentzea tibetensis]TWP52539.1 hypothetical protein FKR81_09455 [Lentzea tibetensis]
MRTQPYVLLAPCYGNPKTRERYHKTIKGSINFESASYRDLLEPSQLAALRIFHPAGSAHFWGALASHNSDMDKLRPGDVVVFVGGGQVKAAGEIGFLFRNVELADLMWDQYEDERSFVNVYSVVNIQVIERPRREVWHNLGFNEDDNVAGQRLVVDERVPRILTELQIVTSTAEARIGAELAAISQALDTGTRVVPVEGFHTDVVSQHVAERNAEYARVESQLVDHYQRFHPDVVFTSFRTHNGMRADLFRVVDDEVEVVEAKSLATHEKVREAAAQLLDYSAHSPQPVTRLSALFPRRPAEAGISYLHRLGIDCVFRTDEGIFVREAATEERRQYMRPVWHSVG